MDPLATDKIVLPSSDRPANHDGLLPQLVDVQEGHPVLRRMSVVLGVKGGGGALPLPDRRV